MIEYKSFTDFPRGTMYAILKDAYSYDNRNKEVWDDNWRECEMGRYCAGGCRSYNFFFMVNCMKLLFAREVKCDENETTDYFDDVCLRGCFAAWLQT